jgi:hypothetical protein
MSQKKNTDAGDVLRRISELPEDEQARVYSELQRRQIDRIAEGAAELLSSLPSTDELLADVPDVKLPTVDEVQTMLLQAVDSRIEACQKLKEHLSAATTPVSKDWLREWNKRLKLDRAHEKSLSACLKLRGTMLKAN